MVLKVLNSNSSGNGYVLESKDEKLLLECGLKPLELKKAIDFDLSGVAGCLLTHEHLDHSKYMNDYAKMGIDIYSSKGTFGDKENHRFKVKKSGDKFSVGKFKVIAFDVKHDAREPFGYMINHEECGNVLFVTDSYYTQYNFKGLNNIIVEANYCKDILLDKLVNGKIMPFLYKRIVDSHMSIQTCMDLLKANDLSAVNNIVLIHLSNSNSDERRFKTMVEESTFKNVHVANRDMVIDFNLTPY